MMKLIKRLFSGTRASHAKQADVRVSDSDISIMSYADESSGEKKIRYYFSVVPPNRIFKHGLIPEAIIGECTEVPIEGEAIDSSKFVANTIFKNFLHKVIESCADFPEVKAEAARIGRGVVTIIDRRVPDLNAAIAPNDILGGFTVESGRVTGYSRNPNHVLLNQFGIFKLDPNIQGKLNKALNEILEKM